jgi:amino acid permease
VQSSCAGTLAPLPHTNTDARLLVVAQVAEKAFGPAGATTTTAILIVMTLFVLLAYMVLVRDIWAGLLGLALGIASGKGE